ncbi:hypothetical protein D9619_005065 [Psilocybe cf. subviscida]|uniref:Secreted protein n=1 Tax=Psilocybe cf. subviscida TaxID=2480587 RepID=A0A8H5BPQ3_9AGAR|nr:hypothetical protein D9619_005065 [Psilocybe cf. subviscida]
MKFVFATLAAAAAVAGSVTSPLTINTPLNAVVCQPLLINWGGGTPPLFLNLNLISFSSILPGNQPSAAALLDFGEVSGDQLTWVVNVTAGTSLGLNLRDSAGFLAQSSPFTVQKSRNTACLRK